MELSRGGIELSVVAEESDSVSKKARVKERTAYRFFKRLFDIILSIPSVIPFSAKNTTTIDINVVLNLFFLAVIIS